MEKLSGTSPGKRRSKGALSTNIVILNLFNVL